MDPLQLVRPWALFRKTFLYYTIGLRKGIILKYNYQGIKKKKV